MTKILVTGASGHLGRRTLERLLERHPAADLVGLVRDPAKAADLAEQGIEIRTGDYFDPASLAWAFQGIEKLLLVPTVAFTDRDTQHANVIAAAKEAGVGHLVYTPIIRKAGSGIVIPYVTEPDLFTEQALRDSGLATTILLHPPFIESFEFYIGPNAFEAGVRVPAGSGKVAPASRDDLAEAQAVVLTGAGHEGKTYSLHGGPPVSFADVAQILSEIHGSAVPYVPVPDEEYLDGLVASGLPQPAAEFALDWVSAVNAGEWDEQPGDLESLLGRPPVTTAQFLRDTYPVAAQ